ncbi:putative ABC transporter ATP-binding protein YfmR [Dissostichus eleginoides]|uniref:ABC transporter ATP-binding protein YfmR n=1 Tax=Dissostichus eleginoides TaxID=100907 RepID=A0AAD9FH52_DISEL|nr:putative ABC transporter ATP-binding protein YfmR [Dissostichus eleginoides]
MEKAMLDLTPPSMENTPPVLAGVEVIQEQQENPGQAVVDPLPHEDFNPPVSSTPERGQRENTSAEKHCKRLQAENHEVRKQNINLKKKLAKMKKEKERATKSETRAKERATLSEKFKPKGGQVLKVVGEELQVSCMRQSGDKNLFMWPQTPDVIFYFRKDIHAAISEPEPATSRFSKLTC